ncbi:unnamed protein product [Arabis nemorensis]|uniref:Reverse transcriptase zinc-binding domain-containing protein n=1 Tax=Arabis nemorensis TaxID=586526 RepID=A0A565BFC7_9BRAS|nr:unnamed protein product [Arabis nemorensis]
MATYKKWCVHNNKWLRSESQRATVGVLPVGEQLTRHGIGGSTNCIRCGNIETVEHVLLHCTWAKKIWDIAPISPLRWTTNMSILEFLAEARRAPVLPPTGISNATLAAWICWNIWTARVEDST